MSDITTQHKYRCDLDSGPREAILRSPLMHQDALADEFRADVYRGDEPLDLIGMAVYGYLLIAATRQTIPLTGTASGSTASVTLPSECYALPGYASLVIQLQSGNVRHTVLKVDLCIQRTGSESIIDPEAVLPNLPELLAQIDQMQSATEEAQAAIEGINQAVTDAEKAVEDAQKAVTDANNAVAAAEGLTENRIMPEMYGAKGDGVTDDSAAIQAAIDAAGGTDIVYLANKTYLINTGLIVSSNYARFVCDGLIHYTGTDAAVSVKSYNTGSGLSRADVRINRMEAENGTAVRLDASDGKMKSTYVDVNYIYKSKVGVHLYADNEYYISYSVIKSKEIKATETGIHIENKGSGEGVSFLNEAFYYLGKITGCKNGVKIINAGAHKFMQGSFEDLAADGMSLYLENSSDNMFRNFRWAENYGSTRIKFVGDCQYNDIEGSRMTLSEIDTTELGSSGGGYNILRAPFIMNKKYGYRCGSIAYVNKQHGITYVPNYDDNSYVDLIADTAFDTAGEIGRIENRIITSFRCDSADIDGQTYTLSDIYSGHSSAARGYPVSFVFGTANGRIKLQDKNGTTILDNTNGEYAGKTVSVKWCGYNYSTKKNAWLVQEQGEVAATERFVRECLQTHDGDMVLHSKGGNTYKVIVKDSGLLTTVPSSSINQVPLSKDTNGAVYNGCGYMDGYRINSSGVNVAASNTLATGYIAATGGDVVLISEWDLMSYLTTDNAIAVYDKDFNNLGVFTAKGNGYGIFAGAYSGYGISSITNTDGVLSWSVPPDANIAYIRISAYRADGETLSVVIDKGDSSDAQTPIVESVNGKTGAVQLSASDVGARPDTWMPTANDVGARPNTWTPSAAEVGARSNTWMPSATDVGALAAASHTTKALTVTYEDGTSETVTLVVTK